MARRLGCGLIIELAVTVALVLGCSREPPEPLSQLVANADPRPLDVDHAGCAEVWLEPVPRCLVAPGTSLRLWLVQPRSTQATVRIDGQPWPATEYFVEGMEGFGLEVTPPPGAAMLEVELASSRSRSSLPLGPWSEEARPPNGIATSREVDAALGRAFESSLAGRHLEALRLLAEVEPLASRYPQGRAELATYQGIVYWGQGRYHDAAVSLRKGVVFGLALRDRGLVGDALPMYVGILAELGYTDAAAEWSAEVLASSRDEQDCVVVAKHLSTLGYTQLLLARRRETPPDAVPSILAQALVRVGPGGECPDPTTVPAILLTLADAALDRDEPATAAAVLADVVFEDVPTADQRLRLLDAQLRALDGMGRPWSELEEPLARLEAAAADAGTPEGRWRLQSRRGDALARRGRLEEAVVAYRRAESEAQRLSELAAVGLGRDAAVTAHEHSTERLVGLLVELGRPAEALCAVREAQARRIQAVGRQPATAEQREALDRAIETYDHARRALDQALLAGRLRPGLEREQLRLDVASGEARRAKAVDDILQAQSTWRPACDDLVPRRDGELLLGLYPMRHGWFVFVQDDGGTRAQWLEGGPAHALDDPALGVELLEPWTQRFLLAQRVRVLASGPAQAVDVHLLQWNGGRLVEHVPVAYGAELPRAASAPSAGAGPLALLIADPTETLASSRQEVLTAAAWMREGGWVLDMPTPDEADRDRILDALARASFFYFSGHGEHDVQRARARALPPYAGGARNWPARLRLRPPMVLEAHDVLMLAAAPRHVVLLGCETGVPGGTGGGMSLALAFLVAGAEEVVATPIAIRDEVGAAIGRALLEGIATTDVSLTKGLQQAQAAMLRRDEPVGRYRVWIR